MSFCYPFCHPFAIRLLSFRSPFWVFTFVFKKPIKFTKHSQRWGFSWVVEQWVEVLITRIDQLCKQLKFHDYINNNLNELKYQISQVIHFFLDEQLCVNFCRMKFNLEFCKHKVKVYWFSSASFPALITEQQH